MQKMAYIKKIQSISFLTIVDCIDLDFKKCSKIVCFANEYNKKASQNL
ncbi:hypothetical protein [Mycoplasma sp. CSL7503-lung]|nr:hypothetical protein [Mycoplasma sp. CSL7503-lung]MCU4706682.1 hypothetical protein [Mycoplasma sp. CSL7503-lung]